MTAFERSLYLSSPRPVDNWSKSRLPGWYRHPLRFRFYPKYEAASRHEALEQYWEEYTARAAKLAEKYPEKFKIFEPVKMESEAGVREILDFVGIPTEEQRLLTGSKNANNTIVPPDGEIVRSWQQQLAQRPPARIGIARHFRYKTDDIWKRWKYYRNTLCRHRLFARQAGCVSENNGRVGASAV
ncbi:MAG: hypothetical protein IJD43_04260 [Thermoguttaceae bacterium]|nr:hypothetical protein [Thermoguttaceae bacterium]